MSPHRILASAGLLLVLLLSVTAALAGPTPDELKDFYEFRHSSALPGMLFGVTPDGQVGFGGAFQQNIPVAYTPTLGNFVVGGNDGSNNSTPQFGTEGSDVNGTAFVGVGLGKSPHGFYFSWMDTGILGEEAWNAQFQATRGDVETGTPALAVGVQDIFNERDDFPGHGHSAQSFYVVATGNFTQATWRPIYWTLGYGSGRFKNGLAGLQLPIDDHFKLIGEWDSFNANAGLAWGLNGASNETHSDVIAYGGMTALKYPVLGLTFTWH